MSNYSLSNIIKNLNIKNKNSDVEYDLNDHEWQFKIDRENEWNRLLESVDIAYIEKFLRRKKLEKIEKL